MPKWLSHQLAAMGEDSWQLRPCYLSSDVSFCSYIEGAIRSSNRRLDPVNLLSLMASTDGNAAPTFDPAAECQALGNYTLRQVEYAKQFLEIAATDHPLAERMLSAPAV